MKRYLPFGIIFLVAVLALGSGMVLYRTKLEAVAAPIPGESDSKNPGAKPAHIRGSAKAPVVLEEFADLQCPPCAFLSVTLKKLEHDYAGSLRVIFRQFPMAMHNHAVAAASATEAAGLQGRFWEMSDLLYSTQNTWSKMADVQSLFEQYAQQIGLDLARFKADLPSQAVLSRIGLDGLRGQEMEVKATPTVFLNNQRIPQQFMTEAGLRGAIDAVLAGKPPFPVSSPTPPPAPTPPSQSAP